MTLKEWGKFYKTLTITTNDSNRGPVILTIKGNVLPQKEQN